MIHSLALQMPSLPELLVILGLGVLFFGKRLPEVGKSLGKGIVEFKKGLKGLEDDIDNQVNNPPPPTANPSHKFDPYTGKPVQQVMFDPYTGKPLNSDSPNTSSPAQASESIKQEQ